MGTTVIQFKGVYLSAPDPAPATSSPTLSSANLSGADFSTFFTVGTHIGAIGTDNWAAAVASVNWQ